MEYEPIVPEQYYHIYNRGNNKEDIFIEEKNYSYFLGLMKKYILPVADIFAYCLLKNHFHLLVKTKTAEDGRKLSQAFSNFFNAYSKAINKTYGRSGSLFKNRFSRRRIKDEKYLKKLIIYIHLNPQSHGFTNDFRTYRHSSYMALISKKPTELKRKEVIDLFDEMENFTNTHLYNSGIGDEFDQTILME